MVLELIERLAHHGATRPMDEALRRIDPLGGDDLVMTYAQLCGAVSDVGARLGSELAPGDVIILSYPNEPEFTVAFLAALAAGVTVFPVHPQSTDAELRSAAERCGAVAVAGTARSVEVLRSCGVREVDVAAAVRRALGEEIDGTTHDIDKSVRGLVELGAGSADGPNLLLQSSGTTGPPKIVRRGGAALDAVARNVATSVGLSPDDRVLGLIPACHSYGVENLTLGPVFAGACVYLCGRLEPHAILRQLEVSGITVFPGVPAMFEMLAWVADGAKRPSSLRCVYSAGAFLPRSVCESFEQRLGVRIGQLFGMTEIGSVTFNDPKGADFDPTSVGLPMAGVRVRIVDPDTRDLAKPLPVGCDGEVAVAAPSMLAGYVRAPDRPCEPVEDVTDGFFLTGDQGHVDESGRLTITGRLKLVVDVGGLKVNLMEVEAVLREHAGVRDCAVVPIAVSETQSRLKAFIVPSAAECPPSSDELRRHLRARLSAHKVPRMFESREALPRSATGKVQRGELR